MKCTYCGSDAKHYFWCSVAAGLLACREEEAALRKATTSQSSQNLPTSPIPPGELFCRSEPITPKELTPQGRGLQGSQSQVEGEGYERRVLVVVQWNGEKPDHALAELVEVLVQPDGSLLECNRRPLLEIGPLIPRKQSADPLRGEPYGVVVSLKMDPFKSLDQFDPRVRNLPDTKSPMPQMIVWQGNR